MSVNFDKKKYLKSLRISEGERGYFDIKSLTKDINIDINKIPFSIRVLIENVLRSYHNDVSNLEHINNLVQWNKDTILCNFHQQKFMYKDKVMVTGFPQC